MANRIFCMLLVLSMINFYGLSIGQENSPEKRQTVGLVLSGGGARGFAHIGVLTVLEKNRIPVDYIGGASMGALIGAMYSMGQHPDEIKQFVASLDWEKLLQPAPSYKNLSYRRKEDRRNIPAPINLIGTINNLKLPNAINSAEEIELLLDRITLPYALISNFDDLPIPFRAVGTDMVDGISVTLKGGSLSRSLRATMSIPGVFPPVRLDGKILSDGGLVNNIPTDVVKAMGADILIVVNIETQPSGPEAMTSLPGILSQTISIATLENSKRGLQQADFIIAPDLGKYSMKDFSESQEIIKLGYQGAQKKISLLKGLSLDETGWKEHLTHRRKREILEHAPIPKFVDVVGADSDATRAIREKLGDKYKDHPLDQAKQDQINEDLLDLKGTRRFESLNYGLIQKEGQTGLLISSNQINNTPGTLSLLELGLDINSIQSDKVNFNILTRLILFDVGSYGAEWRNDLHLGSNQLLSTEYFFPLGSTKLFLSPQASFERGRASYFRNGINLAEYIGQTIQAGVDLGYSFNSRNELRGGYAVGYQKFSRQIGDPLLGDGKGRLSTAGLSWIYNGFDKAQVPTQGISAENRLNYYFDSPVSDNLEKTGCFTQAETEINIFHKVSDKNIFFGFGSAGGTFGKNASPIQKFTLGGRMRLGGYHYEEFRADNYLLGGLGIMHQFGFFSPSLGGSSYLGAWYEGGSAFDSFDDAAYLQSFSGGFIVETPLGPIFVGGSLNENGRGKFYFSFGRFY